MKHAVVERGHAYCPEGHWAHCEEGPVAISAQAPLGHELYSPWQRACGHDWVVGGGQRRARLKQNAMVVQGKLLTAAAGRENSNRRGRMLGSRKVLPASWH